jgi:hypothetical protein
MRGVLTMVLAGAFAAVLSLSVQTPRAAAAHTCGAFHATGLMTRVHVRVVTGNTSCATARTVLRSLFAHKRSRVIGWRCVGPQTGYSQCTRDGARLQGLF